MMLAATIPLPRFTAADAQRASDDWGCNCGPGAVAAIMGLTLDEVRPFMGPEFERKRYTNPTLMFGVLSRIGRPWRSRRQPLDWPKHGLVRIQWHGPWMAETVPIRARYRMTHWVAAMRIEGRGIGVFDINAIASGGWVSLKAWSEILVPWILDEAVPRADGKWSLTHVIEVAPA